MLSDTYFWIAEYSSTEVTEGEPTAVIVSGTGPGTNLTLNYSFGGSAIKGSTDDYTATQGSPPSEATGTIVVADPETGTLIDLQALHDEEIEGDETIIFNLLAGDGYTVGYPPEWGPYAGENDSSIEIALKQAAVAMGDPAGAILPPGATWNSQTKTLTLERPNDATSLEATIHAWVTSGGEIQKNATLSGDWVNLPDPPAVPPGVTQLSRGPGRQDPL